jgi:hypothetical protein
MSDELAVIRSRIPEYAGQEDLTARRLSDQHVRAWLGERLVAVRDRFPATAAAGRLDDLITHCQFGDQRVVRAIESEHFEDPAVAARLDAQDLLVVEVAERAADVTEATVVDFIGEVEGIVNRRVETILAI